MSIRCLFLHRLLLLLSSEAASVLPQQGQDGLLPLHLQAEGVMVLQQVLKRRPGGRLLNCAVRDATVEVLGHRAHLLHLRKVYVQDSGSLDAADLWFYVKY